jgi:hypothetical protein
MATAPVIDGRDRARILADLLAHVPGYTPEWRPAPGTPGHAWITILARTLELEAQALDAMPDRARLALLDTFGNSLMPAQSARAPLVFTLTPSATLDVTLPSGTKLAAKLPPPPPSLAGTPAPTPPPDPIFSVEQTITLARAQLAAVYSVDPDADTYCDHSSAAATGFTLFDAMQPVPHAIYLGHDTQLKLSGTSEIIVSFDLAAPRGLGTSRPLLIDWEYLSEDGWLPLEIVEDQTERLTADGRVTLRTTCGPDAKEETFLGHTSYWIRGTVSARLPTARIGPLPGGYRIIVAEPPTLNPPPPILVTIDGVNTANVVSVTGRTATLDVALAGVAPGAILLNAATSAFAAEIVEILDPTHLLIAGVDTGRVVTVDGGPSVCVLGHDDAVSVLSGPLGTVGAIVKDAATGRPLGTITKVEPGFSVPVEDGREFLEGDVVTVDATTHATVTAVTRIMLTLDGPVARAAVGEDLVLADALAPLRHDGADEAGTLPEVDVIRLRVGFSKTGLVPDAAYADLSPLNVRNTFKPFGPRPEQFSTFYVASNDAFRRAGARISLLFTTAVPGVGYDDNDNAKVGTGGLDWTIEYFDGTTWKALNEQHELDDDTERLTEGGLDDPRAVSFICPDDWAEAEVNGEKNLWLRIRIDSGNYGHPLRISVVTVSGTPTVQAEEETLAAPVVATLTIQYTYYTNSDLPDHCLTFNDFAFADRTMDARWPRSPFAPFVPVADPTPAVQFGFTKKLPIGLVSLFVTAIPEESPEGDAPSGVSPFVWEYYGRDGWTELTVADESAGFARTGVLQFIGPSDGMKLDGLGGELYRVRARLKPGNAIDPLKLAGLWLNGVWARQGESVANDTVGISNGNPLQTFVFPPQRIPVMTGEIIEVREWTGRGDDWQTAVIGAAPEQLRFEVDPRDGKTTTAVWVRWESRLHLLSSGPTDRHYAIERASGIVRFGAPPFGMIPPAGARIVASYTSGGGLAGNVPEHTITELRSGVGYVESVTNPLPAAGGTATEAGDEGRDRSTARFAHRNRAVSASDYEWMAREASPEVARVRCLAIEGPPGRPLPGWVTVLVMPHSTDAAPSPTPELTRRVLDRLRSYAPAGVASRIRVIPPVYVVIGVNAEIVLREVDDVARVEALVRNALGAFLHPVTGGPSGHGFAFGEHVYLSDVAALVEGIDGVDYVRRLQLYADGAMQGDLARLTSGALPTAGDHNLKLVVGTGS